MCIPNGPPVLRVRRPRRCLQSGLGCRSRARCTLLLVPLPRQGLLVSYPGYVLLPFRARRDAYPAKLAADDIFGLWEAI